MKKHKVVVVNFDWPAPKAKHPWRWLVIWVASLVIFVQLLATPAMAIVLRAPTLTTNQTHVNTIGLAIVIASVVIGGWCWWRAKHSLK